MIPDDQAGFKRTVKMGTVDQQLASGSDEGILSDLNVGISFYHTAFSDTVCTQSTAAVDMDIFFKKSIPPDMADQSLRKLQKRNDKIHMSEPHPSKIIIYCLIE